MKQKILEWLRRYLPAEILSFLSTLIAAALTYKTTGNPISTALIATWSGNIVYFGYILFIDILNSRNNYLLNNISYRWIDVLKNIRALALEFGVAEIIDSFLIRPALMYYIPIWTGTLLFGIAIAKIAADFTFYIPAIISYELLSRNGLR